MGHISKHRNKFILAILVVSVLAVLFFGYNKYKSAPAFEDSPAWSNNLILTFNGHEYDVTDQTTTAVGKKIGTIAYHGKIGNAYSLYAINSAKNNDKIAVKTKQGFLIANIKS